MRSFTAKEFSRCPAQVYEAAREHGKAKINHDRFSGSFFLSYEKENGFHEKATKIIDEEGTGWRDLLKCLSVDIEHFEEASIKRIIRLINEKAPD